jgi:hypothetical protein
MGYCRTPISEWHRQSYDGLDNEVLGPTVLTAVMDSHGRLTEISTKLIRVTARMDQIIIDACKQGLWSRNPAAQAVDQDGKYQLRVRDRIRAYMFD